MAAVPALSVGAAGTVTVMSSDVGVNWLTNDTRSGGASSFIPGPGTAPLGIGSLQMTTTDIYGTGNAKAQLFNYSHIGAKLSDLDGLSYWAYRSSASTNSSAQTISLNIEVDYVGDGSSYTTLVFEPVYQPGGVGAMLTDTWQQWDAFNSGNAIWWSTKAIPGVPQAFNSFVSWNTIVANNPNAKIKYGLGFNVGSGWVGQFSGAVDELLVSFMGDATTYDFEPTPPNQPPTANPGGPYLGAVNTDIVFDGTGSSDPDNNPLTYTWDFGDGNFGSGATPSHSYTIPDIYDVCLIVNDGSVNSAEECTTVVVYDPSGGFVTGGGWIDSPDGAMTPISTLVWDQDFSLGDSGWFDNDDAWYGNSEVSNGIATFFGDESSGPFSRFDGYRSNWPGTWIAEIDVYLDPAWPSGQGFDYSVAASGSDGNHQRDYIFHVGVVENFGPITGQALLVNGSNNADFYTNPYKLVNDNGGNYYIVTSAGWYTLQHVFRDAGGYLAVDLNLLDSGGNTLWTATRENVADTIPGEVGGNRYSWFTHIDVTSGIQVDNHQLFVPVAPTGKATFGFVSKYKKGASIPEGTTEFQFKAGGLNFHSDSYDWLVVNQGGTNAQFKGYGTINGAGNYGFMIWAGDGSPDTFRIKIWDATTEEVVYDNGMDQPIGGGSIVVHKK
ncbi:MAG: hypothetical protein C3F07_12345 [Anaerolineales bacterium]|nr:PKD domain-containing protein [Anaerolineae bacterium]PWB72250.1 MAG: hypothetical protein C3F07_12345 [Anaerolineales bacterium]